MSLIETIDTQLLLMINGLHCQIMDTIMITITNKWFWVPFYLLLLAYVIREKRTSLGALWCVLSIVLAVAMADQIGAGTLRESVARLRPANLDNPISPLVHVVDNYRGGRYGFPSCHAANSFALAVFMWLTFRRKAVAWVMFPWALLQCYSRAYLGVHYPGDLLVGALLGSLCASCVYWAPRLLGPQLISRIEFIESLVRRGFFGNIAVK
ncbi:MAG: phosphatase PAP2 family protein [Muribaculaceae bacterium]|nr:phosphatase PAP2 family protein [Muribaculaceae bacterium]